MPRVTVNLPEELFRALKQTAARRGTTVTDLIAESLEFYGIKSEESAVAFVTKVRRASRLPDVDAITLAVRETRAHRRR